MPKKEFGEEIIEEKSLKKSSNEKNSKNVNSKNLLGKLKNNNKKVVAKDSKVKKIEKATSKKSSKITEKKIENEIAEKEKELTLLEKIKAFFNNNPDQISELLDKKVDENPNFLSEYYDLPYRYNETVVKILAQTPKRLFIYWDISDNDIQKYKKAFGENFFEKTYPVLLVYNEEKRYTYEVPINDFANSWYLDIKDPKCKYTVQLGRKFREPRRIKMNEQVVCEENINLQNDYIEIVRSNNLEAPNDHVLFDKIPSTIRYRNVKTYEETTRDVTELISGMAKVYNVYDLYKAIYKEDINAEIFSLNNPSSAGNPSSSMTSSMFK